jgi:two-component system response regulator RegX3
VTRVLVVEDEESFSDALSYMLRKEGFEVAVCPTGPDAIETFDRTGADRAAKYAGPCGSAPMCR